MVIIMVVERASDLVIAKGPLSRSLILGSLVTGELGNISRAILRHC